MASYALRLAMLALLGATLLLAESVARGQTACSFSGAAVRAQTYIAGTALASTGANRLIAFPTATGCTGTIAYTLTPVVTAGSTGTNVPGLTFDGSATPPTLTGTPTAPTGYSDTHVLAYTATPASGDPATIQYRITVEADSTPAFAQSEYSRTFYVDRYEFWPTPVAAGGNYRSNQNQYVLAGTLPNGLRYYQNHHWISAMAPLSASSMPAAPTFIAAPQASHVLTYTDADGDIATTTLRITVAAASSPDFFEESVRILWLLNGKPRNGGPGSSTVDPRVVLQGAGGPGTTYALSGMLPAGLSWDAATRVISGRPTEAGTFPLTLTATDTNNASDTQSVTLIVSPTTAPETFRSGALNCTSVRLLWTPPTGGNPRASALPTVTGYRIEGRRHDIDSGWRLVTETGADDRSYTHAVPPGSRWFYRIRANTAGGVNPWTQSISTSTSVNASRPYRAMEAGTVITTHIWSWFGGQVLAYQWYRSPDQASPGWTPIAGATGPFYALSAADVGRQLGVAIWATSNFYRSSLADFYYGRRVLSFAGILDPILAANSPSFAAPSVTHAAGDRPVDEPVSISLPRATGGSGTVVYELSPALPDGLAFDADALTITGTATERWGGHYTLTARDDDCAEATYTLIGPDAPRPGQSEPVPPAPVIVVPYATITLGVAEEGPAPQDAAYALRLDCGNSWFTPTLAAGETYEAAAIAGSTCSLTVTDRRGAMEARGEFAGRTFDSGQYAATVTLVHAEPEPEPSPTERLEAALDAGEASVRWQGDETSVADVVAALTPRVTAVYHRDAETGAWRSWFPGGEDIGVNTLAAFAPDAVYVVFTEAGEGGATP